jgi:hypothetical protein
LHRELTNTKRLLTRTEEKNHLQIEHIGCHNFDRINVLPKHWRSLWIPATKCIAAQWTILFSPIYSKFLQIFLFTLIPSVFSLFSCFSSFFLLLLT